MYTITFSGKKFVVKAPNAFVALHNFRVSRKYLFIDEPFASLSIEKGIS